MTQARIMHAKEVASYLGYESATASFYARLRVLGIEPLWVGAYDRIAVDAALDRASCLLEAEPSEYEGVKYG